MFEGWKDVPLAVHRRLADWDADHYAETLRAGVEAVRDGREGDQGDYTYVLLHEAEAILRAQEHIYLWPCDCRAIVGKCRKPMDVCLRFDNDRGVGWEISAERALKVLRATDKAGLMHTADSPRDPAAAARHLQLLHRLLLPAPRHRAAGDGRRVAGAPARRLHRPRRLQEPCGRCALRCPFDAIDSRHDGRPEPRRRGAAAAASARPPAPRDRSPCSRSPPRAESRLSPSRPARGSPPDRPSHQGSRPSGRDTPRPARRPAVRRRGRRR